MKEWINLFIEVLLKNLGYFIGIAILVYGISETPKDQKHILYIAGGLSMMITHVLNKII